MNNFLILLHNLMSKFLLFLIAITIFFLFVEFLEEFDLCIEIVDNAFLLFDLVLKAINFVTF